MATNGLIGFVGGLTPQLRIVVTMSIYSGIFKSHKAFKQLKNRRLLTYIGQNFHPVAYESGHCIYKQGDEITALRIATKGYAAFVQPRYKNEIFSIVDPLNKCIFAG
jgi:hypothetical protein